MIGFDVDGRGRAGFSRRQQQQGGQMHLSGLCGSAGLGAADKGFGRGLGALLGRQRRHVLAYA